MGEKRIIRLLESYEKMIQRYYDNNKKYPEALISDLQASIKYVLREERKYAGKNC